MTTTTRAAAAATTTTTMTTRKTTTITTEETLSQVQLPRLPARVELAPVAAGRPDGGRRVPPRHDALQAQAHVSGQVPMM